MTAHRALLSARFRMLLQYRAAALAGMSTQLFWGLIRVMIFEAFYRSSVAIHPMTYPEVVNYVWLGQAMFALLPWWMDAEIRNMVRSGTVVYELVRPVDLYNYWYTRSLASRAAPTLLRSVPLLTIALLCFGLQLPPTLEAAGAWALVTLGALLLGCAISNILHISMLWTITGDGLSNLVQISIFVFSGMIIPLPLFPDWAQPVLNFLPFRGLADVPFRLYIGHIPPAEVWGLFAHQIAWTIALIFFGRWLLSCGVRRMVAQGG